MSDGPSYKIPEDVLAREVDGEMVLLNLETEQYFGLDGVGTNMLTRLTTVPEEQAIAALRTDYEVDEQTLRGDLSRLVSALLDARLLRRVEGA